jgi:hypothetical protein
MPHVVIDETVCDIVEWTGRKGVLRRGRLAKSFCEAPKMTLHIHNKIQEGDNGRPSLSSIVVPLLKGVGARNIPDAWHNCSTCSPNVRDYVEVMGLELILNEAEGYAFLRSRPDEDAANNEKMPA